MALIIDNPELEKQVQTQAKAAGLTVEAYLDQLVKEKDPWSELPLDILEVDGETEAEEIRQALAESEEQIKRGETIPAAQVFAELRAKHGLHR